MAGEQVVCNPWQLRASLVQNFWSSIGLVIPIGAGDKTYMENGAEATTYSSDGSRRAAGLGACPLLVRQIVEQNARWDTNEVTQSDDCIDSHAALRGTESSGWALMNLWMEGE